MPFLFTQNCWALARFLHYLISPLKFHWIGNILVTIMSLSCWVSEGGKWKALSCKCSLSKMPKVVGKYHLVKLFFLHLLVNLGKWKWNRVFPLSKSCCYLTLWKKTLHGSALPIVGAVSHKPLQTHLAISKKKNNEPNTIQNMISSQKPDSEPNVKYLSTVHWS